MVWWLLEWVCVVQLHTAKKNERCSQMKASLKSQLLTTSLKQPSSFIYDFFAFLAVTKQAK